ncbi:MAG TPA: FtsX-like permease family protein, partial [Candidatus Limnocylindrales bacterium]
MTPRTGLAGAVVQRSLADWPVVLAALLLLICATTLLATGVVYGDAVAAGGLHRALLDEPASGRSVAVTLTADPAHLADVDAVVRPALADAMATTGGDILRAVQAGSFANAATPADQVTDLTILESLDGIESQATLVDGAWPQAGGTPVQATTSDAAAAALGVHVGDRLSLLSRQDPATRVDAVISGIWHADPAAGWSRGDPLETTGTTTGGTFTTRGPIVVREADLLGLAGLNRVDVEWRGLPDLGALRVADVDTLRTSLTSLQSRLSRDLPAGSQSRVTTILPDTLVVIGRSVLVSRSGIALVTIQFVILAGYAVLLVAGLLVERRRSEIALLRSRGASATHLTLMALLEAVFLAVPAAAVAPLLAVGLVGLLGSVGPIAGLDLLGDVGISGTAVLASVIAGAVAVVILTLPTLFVSASPAGARAADARQGRAGLPQRLGLDIALVAIAVVALAQLRLYGAPLTVNARGTLGLDPLLVAAPAIGLIAGAVVALRVVPRIAEVLERFLVRGHGLVGALGGRQLARRPLRYSRAALLLILATALGTLTASHAATWIRSQEDQAAWRAAADVRVVAGDYPALPSWAAGPTYRAIPGVAAATPVAMVSFDLGRTIRSGTLVGVDPAGLVAVAAGSSDASAAGATSAGLAGLASASDGAPAVPVPDDTKRLAIDVSATFQTPKTDPATGASTGTATLPPGSPGLSAAVVLRDGDGRVFRTPAAQGTLVGDGQRLVVDLTDPAA